MILGVGIDVVDVVRMERTLHRRWADRFVARVFSREEIEVCRNSPAPVESFAARFAAKEAVAKALGTGFSRGITPAGIQVRGGERTRPAIALGRAALEVAESMNAGRIHVSLTHTPTTASAFVVIERAD